MSYGCFEFLIRTWVAVFPKAPIWTMLGFFGMSAVFGGWFWWRVFDELYRP